MIQVLILLVPGCITSSELLNLSVFLFFIFYFFLRISFIYLLERGSACMHMNLSVFLSANEDNSLPLSLVVRVKGDTWPMMEICVFYKRVCCIYVWGI